MGDLRERLQTAIQTIEDFGRDHLEFRLRPPATEDEVLAVEDEFGMRLPEDLRELYLLHDGQDQLTMTARLFCSEPFAPLARAIEVWRAQSDFWGLVEGHEDLSGWEGMNVDPELRRVPADIRWFPFGVDANEDKQALWVDLNPVPGRPAGQVILEGPWAHPAQYVGPSVVDVLETYAAHIHRGLVGITPFGITMHPWGFGPMSFPLEYVKRDLQTLPPPRFGADVARPLPQAVADAGDLDGVTTLALRRATSLEGLTGGPGFTLALLESGDLGLDALAGAEVHELVLVGEVPPLRTDVMSIQRIALDTTGPEDLLILNHVPSAEYVSIDLGEVDPNDHDWTASTRLVSLHLRRGRLSSLGFLRQLPSLRYLKIQEPRALGVGGIPEGAPIFLQVIDADIPSDVEQLAGLALPASFAGPQAWTEALDGVLAPGVWTGVYEKGDSTTWTDRSRRNWIARRDALAAAGLPPH
jgi:cell wall assembly regulator SMI1